MLKKNTILIGIGIIVLGLVLFFSTKNKNTSKGQIVYEKTLSVSKEYILLRYQTENVLEKAKEYGDYDKWNIEMDGKHWKAK